MEPATKKWMLKVAQAAGTDIEFKVQQGKREQQLAQIHLEIDKQRQEMRNSMTFAVITKDGKVQYSMTETSEQIDELEYEELGETSGLSRIDEDQVSTLAGKLLQMQMQMEMAGFTKEEITEELYFPLVREKLMPETLVPDEYSKTLEMLTETNKLYKEDMKDQVNPQLAEDANNFALAKKGIGICGKLAKGISDMVPGSEMATEIISLTETVLITGVTAAEAIKKGDLLGSGKDILDNIGSILTTALSFYSPDLAKDVAGFYKAGEGLALFATNLAMTPPNIEEAMNSLADAVSGAFAKGMEKSGQTDSVALKSLQSTLAIAIRDAGKVPKLIKAVKEGDVGGIVDFATQVAKDAVKSGLDIKGLIDQKGKSEDIAKSIENTKNAMENNLALAIDGLGAIVKSGKTIFDTVQDGEKPGAAVAAILDNLGVVLTSSLSIYDPKLGEKTGSLCKAGAGLVGAATQAFIDKEPDKALLTLANAVASGFDGGMAFAGKTDNLVLKATRDSIVQAITALSSIPAIVTAVKEGDFAAVVDEVNKVAAGAIKTSFNIKAAFDEDGKSDSDKEDIEKQKDKLVEMITSSLDGAAGALKTGKIVYDAVKKGEISGAAEDIVSGIGDTLGKFLGTFAPPDIAKTVANAYAASTSLVLVGNAFMKKDPEKAIQALSNGFSAAFSMANPDKKDRTFNIIGESIDAAFATLAKAPRIMQLIDEGDYDEAIQLTSQTAEAAISRALKIKKDGGKPPSEEDESVEDEEPKEEGVDEPKEEGVDEPEEEVSDEGAKALVNLKDLLSNPATCKKIKEKVQEEQEKAAIADIEREMEEFEAMINDVDTGGEEVSEHRSIEVLIAQMQKDKLILDLALKITSAGLDMAAKFVPALEIGSSAIKFVASLTAAAKRAMAMNTWMKNHADARSAQSPYSTSIKNFVTNQQEQFAYYTIQATLNLARVIGASLSTSGIGAIVGEPLRKAADLAEVANDAWKTFYDEVMMRKGWEVTKQAFANPRNRRLGLLARQLNPTLAKYSIAWGAKVKMDPLALSAMASCGLNDATLSRQDANVQNVVKYLEVKFYDDRQIKQALPEPPSWKPESTTLTARSWLAVKTAGETKGNLVKEDTGMIEGRLLKIGVLDGKIDAVELEIDKLDELINGSPATDILKLAMETTESVLTSTEGPLTEEETEKQEQEKAEIEKKKKEEIEQQRAKIDSQLLDQFESELNALIGAFNTYQPKKGKKLEPHAEMKAVAEEFQGHAEIRMGKVKELKLQLVKLTSTV